MRELPTGTVTFLFSDIEGSTRLLHELGAKAYAEALTEHRRVMRAAFATHGGVEVDTQGDAFFVAFPAAANALEAAAQAQATLAGGQVQVRMGIHTGKPLVTAEGYVGMDVHQAARVMSAGHGGQVLVSEATWELLDGGGRLVDLGFHRLKDLTAPQRLYQLGGGEFPPLKTLYQTNLPVQPTPLVGRERELGEVIELLRRERLVTLTGAGGSGKTRLALQAAAELTDDFKDGVWWVSLAALRDPQLVEPTTAQVVGAKEELAEHLRQKRTLLLLDNFEQVVEAAPMVAKFLAASPDVRVLVTSRERLAIAAEHEYVVPTLEQSDAVALFVGRARQLKPNFEADDAVGEICRRLDGLPLAIELAAARIKLLRPEQIVERLGRSLDLLTAGARDAPERQRTLRATIEWSYELLSSEEKQIFHRLAVFAGSFSVEAAEGVCETDLETLAALVDKSLLRRTDDGRFFMLETIREYATDQLRVTGDAEARFAAHAEWFLRVAESEAEPDGRRFATPQAIEILVAEVDNLRTAAEWAVERRKLDDIARCIGSTWGLWLMLGHGHAATRWAEPALARRQQIEPQLRLRLLVGAGELLRHTGRIDMAEKLKLELLDLDRSLGTGATVGTLSDLADIALERGDLSRARALANRSAAEGSGARAVFSLAEVELREGNLRLAARLFEQSAQGFAGQYPIHRAFALEGLAESVRRCGDVERARSLFSEAAQELLRLGNEPATAECLDGLAAIVLSRGNVESAATIAGAALRLREEAHAPVWRPDRLPDDLPMDALALGRELNAKAALEYALASID